jgi:hypothetical protein
MRGNALSTSCSQTFTSAYHIIDKHLYHDTIALVNAYLQETETLHLGYMWIMLHRYQLVFFLTTSQLSTPHWTQGEIAILYLFMWMLGDDFGC